MNWARKRITELQLAFMLLTRLPAGQLSGSVPDLAAARWAFPLVGFVIGSLIALCYIGLNQVGLPTILAALLALAIAIIATGGLHEDGLADSADGFGGGQDKEQKLAIMKDSHIGSYGVLALVILMTARIASLSYLPADQMLIIWLIGCAIFSRLIMVGYLCFLPSAREKGLGSQASGNASTDFIAAMIISAPFLWFGGTIMLYCIIIMTIIALSWALLAKRQIGGQTGDICGAGQMLCETAGWMALLVAI